MIFSSLHLAIQDGKGSKEAERQNVLLCVLCADVPRGAQEEASWGVCQLCRVLQEMLWALEGRINSGLFFFFLYPISQNKNVSSASLLNRPWLIVFFPKTMSPKEKGKFEDMAKQDKVRYEREMKNYIPPKGHKKKRFKDPNAPKRPP